VKYIFNDKLSSLLCSIIIIIIGYILYASNTNQFQKHKSWVYAVDNNKQGAVVSASENELLLWNQRKCINVFTGHTNTIKSAAFSHDGQLIVSGSIDTSVRIWSARSGKVLKTLNKHTKGVNKVEFNKSNAYVISAGYDDKLLIWDWKNDKVAKQLSTKSTDFSINSQDILAYVDSACTLTLFDLKSLSVAQTLGHFCGSPVFNPQRNIIAIKDSTFSFIDLNTNKLFSTLNIKQGNSTREVSTYTFTPDGQYLVAGVWGGDIEIWDWQKKRLARTLQGHFLYSVNDLSFNSSNQLISASGDLSLKFWNWNTGDLEITIGNGLFQAKLNGILSIFIFLTLFAGFGALLTSPEHKISSYITLAILTCWSFGIGAILYLFKSSLTKYVVPLIWTTTALSGLFFLSVWFSWLALCTIPISLILCHISILTNRDKDTSYISLAINLIFCGVLCSFAASAGLWK
jgi:hypothetical protein